MDKGEGEEEGQARQIRPYSKSPQKRVKKKSQFYLQHHLLDKSIFEHYLPLVVKLFPLRFLKIG